MTLYFESRDRIPHIITYILTNSDIDVCVCVCVCGGGGGGGGGSAFIQKSSMTQKLKLLGG